MAEEAKKWWGDWEEETQWLEGAESKMADLRPLAGGVHLIKTQKEENEVSICTFLLTDQLTRSLRLCLYNYTVLFPQTRYEEVRKEHGDKMEGVLTSLADLASHDKLVEASPINDYNDGLRARWGAVLEDAEKRVELSTSGHTHLGCYADQSTTFDEWLSFTEKKLASTSTIPGECLCVRICFV